MKSEVRSDYHGSMCVILEFVDNNGVRLITPEIPYPSHFDPMRIEHAEYRGDEIRIKDDNGNTILSVFATTIEYDNPIPTSTNPNGQMFIDPEVGEELTPLRTFSVEHAHASQVGWDTAMSEAMNRANFERQRLDDVIQADLNAREPQTTLGASAWFREARLEREGRLPPNTDLFTTQEAPTPKIKIDFDMKCTCCEGKIHYPDKLVELLGNEGTIKYLEFCKKTGGEPQMFCCECFGIMGRNRRIISAVNKMNQKIKDMMDLKEREEALSKREAELDEQLKKKSKKGLFRKK